MRSFTMFTTKKFELLDAGVTFFQIQNRQLFWDLQQFWQSEGHPELCFTENHKNLKPNKSAIFIGDVGTTVDFTKLFHNQMYKMVLNELDETQIQKLFVLDRSVRDTLNETIFSSDLPIQILPLWDTESLIKYVKPELELTNLHTAYDIIGTLIDIAQRLSEDRLMIFTNVHQYVSVDEFKLLALDLKHQGRSILVLDKVDDLISTYQGVEGVRNVFIDEDFVEFENG